MPPGTRSLRSTENPAFLRIRVLRKWGTFLLLVAAGGCREETRQDAALSRLDAGVAIEQADSSTAAQKPLPDGVYLSSAPAADPACAAVERPEEIEYKSMVERMGKGATPLDRTVFLSTGVQFDLKAYEGPFDADLFALIAGRKQSQLRAFFFENFRRDSNFSGRLDIVMGICGGAVRFVSSESTLPDRESRDRIAAMFMTWRFSPSGGLTLVRASLSLGAEIQPPLPPTARQHLNLKLKPDSLCYYMLDRASENRMRKLKEDFRKAELVESGVFDGKKVRAVLHSKIGGLSAGDFGKSIFGQVANLEGFAGRSERTARIGAVADVIVSVCEGRVWEVLVFNATFDSPAQEEEFAHVLMGWTFPSAQTGFDFFHMGFYFGGE